MSAARRARRSAHERLALALSLLRDPAFDTLITGTSRFEAIAHVMPQLADRSLPALCHVFSYGPE